MFDTGNTGFMLVATSLVMLMTPGLAFFYGGLVVDFIDVGIGTRRFYTFNVADMAVSCGAIALAVVLWHEGREATEEKAVEADRPDPAEA